MKLKFVILIFLFSMHLSAENHIMLARPSLLNIESGQEHVKLLLRWHALYRALTISGLIAGAGISYYSVYKSWSREKSPLIKPALDPINPTTVELDIEKLNWLVQHEYKKFIEDAVNKNRGIVRQSLFWMKKQLSDQLNSILVGVGINFLFNALNNTLGPISNHIAYLEGFLRRTVTSIFHSNTLEWFVENNVNLTHIFNNLEYYAARIEGKLVTIPTAGISGAITIEDNSSQDRCIAEFVSYWALAIQQIEMVLGFMVYKSEINKNQLVAQRMADLIKKIQESIIAYAQEFETNMNDKKFVCFDALKVVRAELSFEFDNFSMLESFKSAGLTAS